MQDAPETNKLSQFTPALIAKQEIIIRNFKKQK